MGLLEVALETCQPPGGYGGPDWGESRSGLVQNIMCMAYSHRLTLITLWSVYVYIGNWDLVS